MLILRLQQTRHDKNVDRDRHQLTLREFDDANQIVTVKHRLIFEEKE